MPQSAHMGFPSTAVCLVATKYQLNKIEYKIYKTFFTFTLDNMAETMSLHVPTATPQQITDLPDPVVTPPVRSVYERAAAALRDGPTPSILVFDCDYTIWPFDCDKHVVAPFTRTFYGGVSDRHGRPSNAYPQVSGIFGAILDSGIPVAFLSRNPSADSVRQLLTATPCLNRVGSIEKSLWDTMPSQDYFHAYSRDGIGNGKDRHFAALQAASGVPFKNMLFFDDMKDNIDAAARQGTTSVLLQRNGLSLQAFIAGIDGWRKRQINHNA